MKETKISSTILFWYICQAFLSVCFWLYTKSKSLVTEKLKTFLDFKMKGSRHISPMVMYNRPEGIWVFLPVRAIKSKALEGFHLMLPTHEE